MTTAADLIAATKAQLLAGHPEPLNRLTTTVTTSDTTLAFDFDLLGLRAGSYLCLDLEVVYVWSTDEATRSAVVQRAQLGSTAAAHTAGALVQVNPLFSNFRIFTELNNDLSDLSSPFNGLFGVTSTTLTYQAPTVGYDLNGVTDLIDVLEITYSNPGATHDWPTIRGWRVLRSADATDFPSGTGLVLQEAGYPGRDIRVQYSRPFLPLTAVTTDVVNASLLPATAVDLPPLGAYLRLVAPREAQRNFNEAEGDTRRAEEVPTGAQISSLRGVTALRESRLRSERSILNKRWPTRRRVV